MNEIEEKQYKIPVEEYASYWDIENFSLRLVKHIYRKLFTVDKVIEDGKEIKKMYFLSLPELHPPSVILFNRPIRMKKITAIDQLDMRVVEKSIRPRNLLKDTAILTADDYIICSFQDYCNKWGMYEDIFRHYISNHILFDSLKGDNLYVPLTTNPFLAFILMPEIIYGRTYEVSKLMQCFSNRPFIFNGDYVSFFDYSLPGGDTGKALTASAIYNLFDYDELLRIGFPKDEGRMFINKSMFGYQPFTVLFLGYYHPRRTHSLYYMDYAFDVGIMEKFKKLGLLVGRDKPYIHNYQYKKQN